MFRGEDSGESTHVTFEQNDEEGNSDPSVAQSRLQRTKGFRREIQSSIKVSAQKMKQDIYSMLLVANLWSAPFFFALISVGFQYAILCFLINDLFAGNDSDNILGVPAGVTDNVAVAQAFGVLLASVSSEDLIDSLGFIFTGFNKETFIAIPGATVGKWCLSGVLKFTESLLSLLVIFVLLLKSESVLSLFLNFAALSFVWAIDDVFYELAKHGYFTESITECAFSISFYTIPKIASKRSTYIRNASFYTIAFVLIGSWGYIHHLQRTGRFLCNNLLAQFGDEYEPVTSRFSGHFKKTNDRFNDRVVYANKGNQTSDFPIIGYCSGLKSWTLTQANNAEYDPCNNPLAWSPTTETFDITAVGTSWVSVRLNDRKNRFIPFSSMMLECIDCSSMSNPSRANCSNSGYCRENKLCECYQNNYGKSCEYHAPCKKLKSEKPGGFIRNKYGKNGTIIKEVLFDDKFELLLNGDKPVLVQEKPVYYQLVNKSRLEKPIKGSFASPGDEDGEDSGKINYNLIIFTGYRWVITDYLSFDQKEFDSITNVEDAQSRLAYYLKYKFHPYFSNYEGKFLSDPMPQSVAGDAFDPSFLMWYETEEDNYLLHKDQGTATLIAPFLVMECEDEDF